jgi:ComF family protein
VEPGPIPAGRASRDSMPRRLADCLLNLLYPEKCFVCGVPVSRTREFGICGDCWHGAVRKKITHPACPACGLPFLSLAIEIGQLCGHCCLELPPYSGAKSFGYYQGELSRVIRELKFHGRKNLARPLAFLMSQAFADAWRTEDFDCVIPVPLHRRRKIERGFNQAELLASGVSVQVGLPLWTKTLHRLENTIPQVGLSDAMRRQNVIRAFSCAGDSRLGGVRVLLIDDVMTTGATVASASLALLDAGACRVSVLTMARAVPGME